MINGKKVGVGVVTYNRIPQLNKLLDSLTRVFDIDVGVVVNDGDPLDDRHIKVFEWSLIENETNLGVGKSKNLALNHLLSQDCDYLFLIEDDIYVKDPQVFEKYIEASEKTGIQHFNFSQHGMMNKAWPGGTPNPRTTINYGSSEISIPLYHHCVGAFSFYTRDCLQQVGLLDERYYNACEHVDHTLEIIKAQMHPPFWYFADIENSWEYLGDEEWSRSQSTISGKAGHDNIVAFADEVFRGKHGCTPGQIYDATYEEVVTYIKHIKNTYAV